MKLTVPEQHQLKVDKDDPRYLDIKPNDLKFFPSHIRVLDVVKEKA